MRRHDLEAYATPSNLFDLPGYTAPEAPECSDEDVQRPAAGEAAEDDSSEEPPFPCEDAEKGTSDDEGGACRRAANLLPDIPVRCGELPGGLRLEDFHVPPRKLTLRNAEGRYMQDFADKAQQCLRRDDEEAVTLAEPGCAQIPVDDASMAADRQKKFFHDVDHFQVCEDWIAGRGPGLQDRFGRALQRATKKLQTSYKCTETVVMEYAFILIQEGLLNIPDVGTVNVKQARAFLWNAAWLQEYMNAKWRDEGLIADERVSRERQRFADFSLAIMGPGGTGKTAVLRITEA